MLLLCPLECAGQSADGFVMRGSVPGASDNTEITFYYNGGKRMRMGYVEGGKFEVRGSVDDPTPCMMRLYDTDTDYAWDLHFFVENGVLTFTTPHRDSLPSAFSSYDIRKERNYTLHGSEAQNLFYKYQQSTIPLRHEIHTLAQKSRESHSADDFARLHEKQAELDRITSEFIVSHDCLNVNLHVAESLKKAPFTYDRAWLDELGRLFAPYTESSAMLDEFREYLSGAGAFVKGTKLEDNVVIAPDGESVRLLDQLGVEGYTVIDFWASWCGPCRFSIPHLKKLHERCGGRVKFISIAVSDMDDKWREAMLREEMPWDQFRDGDGSLLEAIGRLYKITAIPSFLLIDPEGRIVYRGSLVGELELEIEAI